MRVGVKEVTVVPGQSGGKGDCHRVEHEHYATVARNRRTEE